MHRTCNGRYAGAMVSPAMDLDLIAKDPVLMIGRTCDWECTGVKAVSARNGARLGR